MAAGTIVRDLFGLDEVGGVDRQPIHVGMGVAHLREFLTEHVGRQHPRAFVQEGVHDATPDPAGASRHDHSSSFEPHRRVRSFLVVGADGHRGSPTATRSIVAASTMSWSSSMPRPVPCGT